MTWIKLDDKCPRHPKVAGLTDRAFRWWVVALCYASEFLTDGELPPSFVRTVPTKSREELLAAGLWISDGGLHIHDYLEHQTGRAAVERERERGRHRRAGGQPVDVHLLSAGRPPGIRDQIQKQIQRTDPEPSSKNEDGARASRVAAASPGLVTSPADYDRLKRTHRHVGARVRVPNVLHAELVAKLGGENPDAALAAWYATLDLEVEASKEPIPDVFAWLRPKFVVWAGAAVKADDWAKWAPGGAFDQQIAVHK